MDSCSFSMAPYPPGEKWRLTCRIKVRYTKSIRPWMECAPFSFTWMPPMGLHLEYLLLNVNRKQEEEEAWRESGRKRSDLYVYVLLTYLYKGSMSERHTQWDQTRFHNREVGSFSAVVTRRCALLKMNYRQNLYTQLFNLAMGIVFKVLKDDTHTHTDMLLG